MHTAQRIEDQQKWWEEEGMTRVEPGGLLILMGQRMGPDDLYAYSLRQTLEDTDTSRFRRIIFPAHDDENCRVHNERSDIRWHSKDSPAWPKGCLLDPLRLPWHGTNGLLTIRANTSSKYEVQYQQRDTDPQNVLVQRAWIDGGKDADDFVAPGCWDTFRDIGGIPKGLSTPYYSTITADPSASNWWAVGWWIYHPASESRFLIRLHHEKMDANDLLDYNALDNCFYGLLNEWVTEARSRGNPIQRVIVEANACQRWLLQYDHFKRWQRIFNVDVIAHTTGTNKLDPELGIQSIANRYKYGNIRLPGTPSGRNMVESMVTEATQYEPANPKARPDDTLMMTWFHEFHLPKFTAADRRQAQPQAARPSWMKVSA